MHPHARPRRRRRLAFVPLASVPTATARAEPLHTRFTLYKMMNRIGVEDSVLSTATGDTTELRTAFAFTDRKKAEMRRSLRNHHCSEPVKRSGPRYRRYGRYGKGTATTPL